MSAMNESITRLTLAKDIAFEWFKMHSEQRLKIFNFFLLISGISIAGYFTAIQADAHIAALVVSFFVILMCVTFKLLDMRTSELIKIGEYSLRRSLTALASSTSVEFIDLVDMAEQKTGTFSYRFTFNMIFVSIAIISGLGAIGAIYSLIGNAS